ncbi:Glutamine synthetase/guanido kinase [Glarea lozoyensis ATCC 20868]|uniref:Glutamine synthetase/guanido kinase n=1 Tax=Glarea lozoyensis (strain ATCC 20868 / MF5171) TaxID=1116229 RepID=S3D6V7_GLAL2|nr:Glutamine synthetase/guanido kinase [Glarea lozoyensis ATCC 20868]EPE34222.1 Glutamine synthetase/guanido kinase [Glarea lozoyensis ATCC 20868]
MANFDGYVRTGTDAAGSWVGFGTENRDLPVRKISDQHWEFCMLDSISNPYLFSAAILLAGLSGLDQKTELVWTDCHVFPNALDDGERANYQIDKRMPASLTQLEECFLEHEQVCTNGIFQNETENEITNNTANRHHPNPHKQHNSLCYNAAERDAMTNVTLIEAKQYIEIYESLLKIIGKMDSVLRGVRRFERRTTRHGMNRAAEFEDILINFREMRVEADEHFDWAFGEAGRQVNVGDDASCAEAAMLNLVAVKLMEQVNVVVYLSFPNSLWV